MPLVWPARVGERDIPLNEAKAAHIPEGFAMVSVVYR